MDNLLFTHIAVISLIGLSACSGTNSASGSSTTTPVVAGVTATAESSTDTAEPTEREVEALTGGNIVDAEYNATSGIFTITLVGSETQLARFGIADHGKMLAMRDSLGVHNAYFGKGRGTKVAVYSGGLAGSVSQVAGFSRTAATALPLTGTARFDGQYAGFTTTRRINGTARLDVDFEGSTVSGWITDREFRQRPDNVLDAVNPLATLRLESTSLKENGTFAGDTGGGQIIGGQEPWNPAKGSYSGLIGGADADEAVGSVVVTHQAPSGASFDEVGGFFATR